MSDSSVLDDSKSSISATLFGHERWLSNLPGGKRADFSKADLSNYDFSNATLERAALVGTVLEDAKLIGTNLSEADLFCSNLNSANLRGANLTKAILRGVSMRDGSQVVLAVERAPRCVAGRAIQWKIQLILQQDVRENARLGPSRRSLRADL